MNEVHRPNRLKDKVLLERVTGDTIVLTRAEVTESGDFAGFVRVDGKPTRMTIPAKTVRRQKLLVGHRR